MECHLPPAHNPYLLGFRGIENKIWTLTYRKNTKVNDTFLQFLSKPSAPPWINTQDATRELFFLTHDMLSPSTALFSLIMCMNNLLLLHNRWVRYHTANTRVISKKHIKAGLLQHCSGYWRLLPPPSVQHTQMHHCTAQNSINCILPLQPPLHRFLHLLRTLWWKLEIHNFAHIGLVSWKVTRRLFSLAHPTISKMPTSSLKSLQHKAPLKNQGEELVKLSRVPHKNELTRDDMKWSYCSVLKRAIIVSATIFPRVAWVSLHGVCHCHVDTGGIPEQI